MKKKMNEKYWSKPEGLIGCYHMDQYMHFRKKYMHFRNPSRRVRKSQKA